MLKKNKGFTLIELLAVILVLGIIITIITPIVFNTIETARKGAFRNSAYGILRTVDYEIASNGTREVTYHYQGDDEWSIPEGYKLDFSGSKPEYGKIIVDNDGRINLTLYSGKWCAIKDFDEEIVEIYEISIEECLDKTTLVTIELIGEETEYVEINTSYTEPGVIAKNKDGEIIEEVKVEIRFEDNVVENIDVSKLGTYEIIYTAEYMQYKAIASRTVVVRDTIPPVLTIPSNVTLSVEELSSYDFMDGVSVYDNSLEEIEVIMSGNVVAYPGEYTITYKAEDSSGNKVEKERYITVIDTGYPEITIIGDNPVNINVGDEYVDSGATAIDDVDGDITDQIIVTGTVNPNIPGTYTITYRVTDSSGNETVAIRTVHVIDNIPPTIVFGTNGNSTYAKIRSTTVTVTDAHGTVTGRYYKWSTSTTTPSSSSFNQTFSNGASISTPSGATGGYYLWIKAVDNSGNEKITRSNVFNLDNTGPNITSLSIDAINVTENSFVITRNGDASDTHSGLADNPYKYQISTNGSSWTTKCTSNSTTCNVTGLSEETTYYYRLCVNDVLSNESCTSSKIVKTLTGDFDVAKGVNKPILTSGMTPIKWNGTTEVTTTENDLDWYDYNEKRWANAKTADGSYWVWIPRYGYKITSCFHSNCSGGAGNIEIKFLIGTSNEASDGTIVETSGYNFGVKDTSTHYFLHPAFTFGDEELPGFWVAKFEPSGSASNISIKPNVSSLRSMKIGNQFDAAYNMRNNSKYGWNASEVDTHMMKNTEWGAVAYLSQSEYGANEEIWINNSSTYTTGCAGNSVSAGEYNGCQNAYNTTNGQKASTTHNIYGVYDMSGGAMEYVAAYVDNGDSSLSTYGQSIINADLKYKDVYLLGSSDSHANNYEANKNKYGDAVYETSSSGNSSTGSWNRDYSYMPYSSWPWFRRGGYYGHGANAGAFDFSGSGGGASSYYSFRPVVAPLAPSAP